MSKLSLLLFLSFPLILLGFYSPRQEARTEIAGIHNLHRLNDRILSGSSPEGAHGFAELRRLGVRSIISVDGTSPDVELAEQFSLRYVHLPIGYDGIPKDRLLQLAKAVRDLPGPIYIHCHHGKHRGPAAAVAATMCLDKTLSPEQAMTWMKNAGTDPHYLGLYRLPQTLQRPPADELERVAGQFPSRHEVNDLTARMVEVDETWDRLKLLRANGWQKITTHPDTHAPLEAFMLTEHYREAARMKGYELLAPEFTTQATVAEQLTDLLRQRQRDYVAIEKAYQSLATSCTACHKQHRDNK